MTMEDVALDIDIGELPDSDALPVGKYRFRIDTVGKGVDKKQNGYLKFTYSVVDGDFVTQEARENYVPFSGRALLKKILVAIAWKHKKLTTANMDKMIGMEFNAMTRIESSDEYGDKTRIAVYLDPNSTVEAGDAPV